MPSLDDSEDCATPFGFSKNLCYSQHLRLLLSTLPFPQPQNSAKQLLKSQRPCGGQNQYIATQPCMPELPSGDEQQMWKVCTRLLTRTRDSSNMLISHQHGSQRCGSVTCIKPPLHTQKSVADTTMTVGGDMPIFFHELAVLPPASQRSYESDTGPYAVAS